MDRICSIDSCSKPVASRGWCPKHLARWSRHGHPLATHWDRFNRYEIDGDSCRLVMLDRKLETESVVLFDPADESLLRSRHWHLGNTGYAITFSTVEDGGSRRILRMHRMLLGLDRGRDTVVDHINGDPLDNRRANLRVVPQQINCSNREIINGNGSSKYRGVSWDRRKQTWVAYIKVNYRKRHLGSFSTEEGAAEAVARFREQQGLPPGY